jgi:hypothetical protein
VSDPLDRIRPLLDEADRERDTLRHQKSTADMEIHQLRRRLARAEDAYREVDQLNQQLKQQIETAERSAEQSRRAMLDHAART